MEYKAKQEEYTSHKLPNAWNEVVRTERKAELFIYGLLLKCMENFSLKLGIKLLFVEV